MSEKKFKYNIEEIKSIDPNVPHGIILSQIKPNSYVLECGCATGYMTKYMTEKLGCHVHIIEYNTDAFRIAKQYAEDGICADLLGDKWQKKFAGCKYDHIIIADVLEHLYDPRRVLKELITFLKEDGKVHVSIPNIAHNDIILNLINDNWNYTSLGLLDNTHIRFWAYNNLKPFFEEVKLSIVKFDYSFVQTGVTEQANYAADLDFITELHKRQTGDIYQFVITLQKEDYVAQNNIVPEVREIKNGQEISNLYYSSDGVFSGEQCISALYMPPIYSKRFYLRHVEAPLLRFDPLEQNACVVCGIEAINDRGESLECFPVNGIRFGKYDLFLTSDPYYYMQNKTDNQWLDIQMRVVPIFDTAEKSCFAQIVKELKQVKHEYEDLHKAYEATLADRENLQLQIKNMSQNQTRSINIENE